MRCSTLCGTFSTVRHRTRSCWSGIRSSRTSSRCGRTFSASGKPSPGSRRISIVSSEQLLAFQTALIHYLTEPASYGKRSDGPIDAGILDGVDRSRLELLGLLSEGKRISKVQRIFAGTLLFMDRQIG